MANFPWVNPPIDNQTEVVEKTPKHKKNKSNRFALLNSFIDARISSLTRSEMAVWFVLYRDTKANGLASCGYADLARRAGCVRSVVVDAVKSLIKQHLLTIVKRGSQETGVSVYRVHCE